MAASKRGYRYRNREDLIGEIRDRRQPALKPRFVTIPATYPCSRAQATTASTSMSAPNGMVAPIARVSGGCLATRNPAGSETTGLDLASPGIFDVAGGNLLSQTLNAAP